MSDTSARATNLVQNGFSGTAVTASRLIKAGDGMVKSVIVNSHTSGTFQFFDGLTAVRSIGGTYTPATGSSVIPIELAFDTGIYLQVAGTVNLTVVYN